MTKVDKSCRGLSLQADIRLSELAIERGGEFAFNNEKLKTFLHQALNHLKQAANQNDAEHIAHFLMGIKKNLPQGLSTTDSGLNDEQKNSFTTRSEQIVTASLVKKKMKRLSQN